MRRIIGEASSRKGRATRPQERAHRALHLASLVSAECGQLDGAADACSSAAHSAAAMYMVDRTIQEQEKSAYISFGFLCLDKLSYQIAKPLLKLLYGRRGQNLVHIVNVLVHQMLVLASIFGAFCHPLQFRRPKAILTRT